MLIVADTSALVALVLQGGLRLESRGAGNLPARYRKPGLDGLPSAP